MSKEIIELHVFTGRLPRIALAVSGPTQQAVHWHKPLVLRHFACVDGLPAPALPRHDNGIHLVRLDQFNVEPSLERFGIHKANIGLHNTTFA